MRVAYQRPWPAIVFYVLAAVAFLIYLLMGISFMVGGVPLAGQYQLKEIRAAMLGFGVMLIASGAIVSSVTAAVGYVIELIAKIEWNTRPSDFAAPAYNSASTTVPASAAADTKWYYYIDKGPLVGPLAATDLLNLVRDGRLSIATRYFVEESGQRRPLTNLSEINL